ncbi:transmembrane protein, putative [Medicago truncatula]|uniref:Transmembrane protein, putative n=1 Tax=Medicago truncatula TaxID=3880 RepID=A0A072TK69_MEDTR|nr:transmembrane protein, putative [Medicago truncatula]
MEDPSFVCASVFLRRLWKIHPLSVPRWFEGFRLLWFAPVPVLWVGGSYDLTSKGLVFVLFSPDISVRRFSVTCWLVGGVAVWLVLVWVAGGVFPSGSGSINPKGSVTNVLDSSHDLSSYAYV